MAQNNRVGVSNRRKSMQPLRRYVIPSDDHEFIGRVHDLLMPVETGFDSYEQAEKYADAIYVLKVGERVERLTRRVESLNLVGAMLWSRYFPGSFKQFPISRYEWLNVTADTFLMRLISVTDCALLLTNEVFRTSLKPRSCTIDALQKKGIPATVLDALRMLSERQLKLREERNARIHHGIERGFSDDDVTFRTAALFEHRLAGISGSDKYGRPVDLKRFFRSGLQELRTEFVPAVKNTGEDLNRLYDLLQSEFEATFSAMFRARTKPLPWE